MSSLPVEGRSQEIGRLAGRALGTKLPKSWIEKELDGDTDFGIDYFIQLKSDESLVSFSFYLQLKGTTVPNYNSAKTFISYDFNVETLRYYHQQEPLVMVAVVDIQGNEDRLWECPIYYCWLDEDWFEQHKEKLIDQKTISVKIPTEQLLNQSLDVFSFYSKRITEKFAIDELKRGIKSQNKSVIDAIETIADAVTEKPNLLQSLEEKSDAPWLINPEGTVACELKRCSEILQANNLDLARRILKSLEPDIDNFTPNEHAEIHYQKANVFALDGKFEEAEKEYSLAYEADQKERYQLAYIESKFKKESLPTQAELEEIIDLLDNSSYHKCIVKAKSLSILNRPEEALNLLRENYPEKIIGQMVVFTISGMVDDLDEIIEQNLMSNFESDRDTYLFNSIAARRYFHKATHNEDLNQEALPLQGKKSYDINSMKRAFVFTKNAWSSAKDLGYPSDIIILLDISLLVYGYFDAFSELTTHIESMLSARPNNPEIIRPYSKVLFNTGEYQTAISLIERLENLDADDCGILLLSHYHLGQKKTVLELVKKYEKALLARTNHNILMIFCIASEIANEMFEPELSTKYENIVRSTLDGESFFAIRMFINSCNSEPKRKNDFAQELYKTYLKLDRPLPIAEQLFGNLDAHINESAEQIIELGEYLLESRELTKNDYLHLAQAFLTTSNWKKAEGIAIKNIEKGIAIERWQLILSASLSHQGNVGEAYKAVQAALSEAKYSKDTQISYINLCISLGLFEEVVEVIQELYTNSFVKSEKIYFLRMLISVYSNNTDYSSKLKNAINKYGELVDQNDSEEEGQYLLFFLTSPKHEGDDEKVKEFQKRLAAYTKKFPDSKILRQGFINTEDDASSIIKSMQELAGITEEQIELWDKNKRAIRNGALPVPFSMRQNFLDNTNDIFTTWAYSLNYPDEFIEYRIKHAPQLLKDSFCEKLESSTSIVLEETTLLSLSELNVLDTFLNSISKFSILRPVFENINQSIHRFAGTPYNAIPKRIQKLIHKHLDKLTLVDVEGDDPIARYSYALENKKSILLTEDLYLQQFIKSKSDDVLFGNLFNVIEYLHDKGALTVEQKFELVVKACDLGLFEPNMRMDLLRDTFIHYLDVINGVDYGQTKFKAVFDKLFEVNRDKVFCLDLLFRMLHQVDSVKKIENITLRSLFKGFLIRHPIKTEIEIASLWFIMKCLRIPPEFTALVCKSDKHYKCWQEYKDLVFQASGQIDSFEDIVAPVIKELFVLNEEVRNRVFKAIMSCFTPMTQEADIFENLYQKTSFSNRLLKVQK